MDGVLQPVDDPSLARAILKKVNEMNVETGVGAIGIAAAFAALPQSASAPLVFFAILYGGKCCVL